MLDICSLLAASCCLDDLFFFWIGGMGHTMMASYSSVMLVGGGSGVTFVLGQAEELVEAVRAGRSSLKFIEIVWTTQDQGEDF